MTWLIIGLILFLGAHSIRMVADDWRTQAIASWGEKPFKGVYSLLALVGFYAMVTGYAEARLQTVALWTPPIATRHVSVLLMLFASVLMAAAYVPRNHLKMRMGHPMVLSVKVWALAHLLANGNLADVVLFGSFLVWSVFNFKAARARDRAAAPEALRPPDR
ncbi:MAG: protein NrnU [Betaproteobacteria bacterium]|nr:protein NrnU [Betaproteobacteria bacterium]